MRRARFGGALVFFAFCVNKSPLRLVSYCSKHSPCPARTSDMQQADYDRWIAPVQARMVNCVWRIVRDTADTDDVIQDVLLHFVKRFDDIRRHPNPTALMLRISTQKALDCLRRRRAHGGPAGEFPEDRPSLEPGPRQLAADNDRRTELLAFISRLPAREAEAITLHAIEDLDYPAVSAAMDCSESTVRVLVGRARERFRTAFDRSLFFTADNSSDSLPRPEPQRD